MPPPKQPSRRSPSFDALQPSPLVGVTSESYQALGRAFIGANGGHGFIVALRNGETDGEKYSQTLKQFGAWLSFLRRIGVGQVLMLRREFYTVPAEWPHQFSIDATVQGDHECGHTFERRWFDEINGAPMRGNPPRPDKPRTLADTRRVLNAPREPFRPFPRLWEVFAHEPAVIDMLDGGLPFQQFEAASRALATQGPSAAGTVLGFEP